MKHIKLFISVCLFFCIVHIPITAYAFSWEDFLGSLGGGGGSAPENASKYSSEYAKEHPNENCTYYVNKDGYFYIDVYQTSATVTKELVARYKISAVIGDDTGTGHSHINYTIECLSGTNHVSFPTTMETELDGIPDTGEWYSNMRQYVLPIICSTDVPGFCLDAAQNGETQLWASVLPDGRTKFRVDTNACGMTNFMGDGLFHHDTGIIYIRPKEYTLTFNTNNPDGNHNINISKTSQKARYTYTWGDGGSFPTPSKPGYTFLGWFTDPSGGTQITASTQVYGQSYINEGGDTAYAHWSPNSYIITFQGNNPDSTNDVSIERGNQTSYYGQGWGALPNASKSGYDFLGWFTAASGGSQISASTVCTGNITAYAHWKPKTYTLRFEKNNPNGVNDISLQRDSQTVTYNSKWGTLPTISKPGYRFKGWFTLRTGGTQYTADTMCFGAGIINNNGAVAYAHWEPIEYIIKFHGNRENAGTDPSLTGSMADIRLTYDETKTLPLNAFAKKTSVPSEDDGGSNIRIPSVFLGWSADPLSITPAYADGASIKNLTTSDSAVINLYAVWDDAPSFVVARYPDRYFTLEEAQTGFITEEELLRTVEVYDRESHMLPRRTGGGSGEGVTVVGYDASEFTSLKDDGAILVRYKVEDGSGTYCFLNIYAFVSRNGMFESEKISYTRGISGLYADKDRPDGGLQTGSVWKAAGASVLTGALTGSVNAYDIRVGKDDLTRIRDYVNIHGFGNSQNGNALSEFWSTLGIRK